MRGLRPPWHPRAGARLQRVPPSRPGALPAWPQGQPAGPSEAPTDCALSFQILGAVILGFGVWILADKNSFISVLRKDPPRAPLPGGSGGAGRGAGGASKPVPLPAALRAGPGPVLTSLPPGRWGGGLCRGFRKEFSLPPRTKLLLSGEHWGVEGAPPGPFPQP